MNILFRVDSSSTIGTGHIMRDLVLADKYAKDGLSIIFATQELEGNINNKIEEAGYKVEILKDNTLDEFQKVIDKHNTSMVVIDHYGIDYDFEKKLKTQNLKLKILSFDDTYAKHYCDILLNHNISADEKKYKDLVPDDCELRCGSQYTLLRDEFIQQKKTKSVLLAMGGADHSNINIDILEVLEKFTDIEVNLVTTTANKNLDQLKEYIQDKKWIELYINSNQIARLMKISDFAIVTPSVTLNEIFFMELPFVAIKTAENQEDMAQYLRDNNYLILNEFNKKVFEESIEKISKPKIINFIDLSLDEKKMILDWRNHLLVRKWMFTQDKIMFESHLNYIDSLKTKKDRVYFLVKEINNAIGIIDFTAITKTTAKIGLYSNPNLRGVGKILMQEIIDYAFNELKLNKIISEVFKANESAIKLYKQFGFKKVQQIEKIIVMELKNENR